MLCQKKSLRKWVPLKMILYRVAIPSKWTLVIFQQNSFSFILNQFIVLPHITRHIRRNIHCHCYKSQSGSINNYHNCNADGSFNSQSTCYIVSVPDFLQTQLNSCNSIRAYLFFFFFYNTNVQYLYDRGKNAPLHNI